MKNPFSIIKEQSLIQWIWNNKRWQMISMTLFGLIFIISATLYVEEWWSNLIILAGVLWILVIGFLHPALIYRDLMLNYDAFEKSVNKDALNTPSRKDFKRIILAGAAGSGKDYLRNGFEEKGFPVDISVTTRPMRSGEVQGKTYHYVGVDHFKHLDNKGRLYESVNFNGAHYGTLQQSWDDSIIFIMTPSGIAQISEEDKENCIIVYLDIEESVRRERMQKRSDNGFDDIERRISADNKDFKGFSGQANMIITNPIFDRDLIIKEILNRALLNSPL